MGGGGTDSSLSAGGHAIGTNLLFTITKFGEQRGCLVPLPLIN